MSTTADALIVGTQLLSSGSLLYTILSNAKMNETLFAWHPKLAMTAFSVMLGGGYLMLRAPSKHYTAKTRMLVHQASMAVGTASAYAALFVIYKNKNINNRAHLTTPHSWLGATTAALLGLINVGTAALYYGVPKKCERDTANKLWTWHRRLTKAALATMAAAVVTGSITTFKANSSVTMRVGGGVVAGMLTLAVASMKYL